MDSKDDADDLLISALSDEPGTRDLVEMFVTELPTRVKALHEALQASDFATFARLSHQLKGAAGGYGFQPITDAARELEATAKTQQDIESLSLQLRELADLCGRARAEKPDPAD